uniref:7TM_GPCR_Srx domain-containing protein n=1 Tax=Globodera pallida TaxID=36090 RepID=A0A183C9F4_GLOPA
MNVAILAAYKRVNAKHGNANEHNAKIEFRLMMYALMIFMIQAFVCIFWIAIYMLEIDASLFTHIIGHYILLNDLRAFVFPAWFLLWASSDIRKHVQKFVFCTKKMSQNASLMVNNGSAQKQIVPMPIKSVNVVTIR